MVAEALGGWLTGSLALLADAGHMLTDTVSLVLAWYAFHLSGRAGDGAAHLWLRAGEDAGRLHQRHRHLRRRAVDLSTRRGAPDRADAGARLGRCCGSRSPGLRVNIACFFVLHGGDRESLNMRGAILHVMGDLLGSVAAIAAAVDHPRHRLDADRPDPVGAGGGADPVDSMGADARRRHVLLEGAPPELDRDAHRQRHRRQCRRRARNPPYASVVARRRADHGDAARLPG